MNNHIILTLGRSGSNTLCDMLNQSPEVLNFGEILGEWTKPQRIRKRMPRLWQSDEAFLKWILTSNSLHVFANLERTARKSFAGKWSEIKRFRDIKTFGVKEFSLNFERYGLTEQILRQPGIRVIGLVRRNVVARMVSVALLGATGVVAVKRAHSDRAVSLRIDPDRIGLMLDVIEAENHVLKGMLGRVPSNTRFQIDYEELYQDQANLADKMRAIFTFLGVEPILPSERMKKIINVPLREIIENLDDCLEGVRGTRHEELLREAVEARQI